MSSFTNVLIVSPLKDGKLWVNRNKFFYDVGHEGSGDTIEVPSGFITDFASIPRVFWVILPKWGRYGNASVVHDYLYFTKERSRKEADDIFYEAMIVSKTNKIIAKIMYYAVRLFGSFAYNKNKNMLLPIKEKYIKVPIINITKKKVEKR